ncbi:carbohydrate ABC transporter permease [Pseudoroseicyclus tamaricis]|uniref:sn-glycerol-3-phosphate transport system permease protein UgpE n=1 Tax=Pseudoroseicyclus tamaricis TaxID=2705421 RepID=A0A6B2JXS4_9RHOB|nr:carbohydrate ABC transporter permease [Pseudoroseicyclus tamaricis]NDV01074.1 carbohydrate ABC transporter permease [Pseudoroseicyclus tamaricis]
MLGSRAFTGLSWAFLIALSLTMVIPVLGVFATAFSSKLASMQPGVRLWPDEPSLEGFATLFRRFQFWRPFLNTAYVVVVGTVLHVALCALAGYALAQEDLPGRNIFAGIILVTLTIPTQTIMVPLFVVFRDLGLLNTLFSLIVAELVSAFSILLLKSYFEQIPKEILESARLDGAGPLTLFWRIAVPLARPGLITITAFNVVWKYNIFVEALIFINDPDKVTLQVALQSVVGGEGSTSTNDIITPNVMMAGVVVALVPLLLFFAPLQRFLTRGTMMGAVK